MLARDKPLAMTGRLPHYQTAKSRAKTRSVTRKSLLRLKRFIAMKKDHFSGKFAFDRPARG
jgi:hypothetical protein